MFFFPFPLFSRPSFLAAGLAGVVFFGTFQAVPTSQSAAPDVKRNRAKSKPLLRSCGRGAGGWWPPPRSSCMRDQGYGSVLCAQPILREDATPHLFLPSWKIYRPTPGGWQVWERSGRGIHLFFDRCAGQMDLQTKI